MAVDLYTLGNGTWAGGSAEIQGYLITEDATPLAGGEGSGSVGGGSITLPAGDDSGLPMHEHLELVDTSSGRLLLQVSSVGIKDGVETTVDVDNRLIRLMATHSIPPYNGTLGGWFDMVFAKCGITTNRLVTPSIASVPAAMPGYTGVVWDMLKQVCAAEQVEIAQVSSNVLVRPVRTRELELTRTSSSDQNVSIGDAAQHIEVITFENVWRESGLVYPTGGWNEDVQVLQVDANETVEVYVDTDVSMVSVVQPTPVVWVSRTHNTSSVYAVAGNDGLPIQPAQWLTEGGKLTVEIDEDFRRLKVTIVGPNNEDLAPYTISMNAGTSDTYSSLRVMGKGLWQTPTTSKVATGAGAEMTAEDVGETIELPFARTSAQAAALTASGAQLFAGLEHTVGFSGTAFNRKGDTGVVANPEFEDFDALYSGLTFDAFETAQAGKTFDQFDAQMNATVADSFENQAFGNLAGARFRWKRNYWRVVSATIAETDQSVEAVPDTTFADFDTDYAGLSFDQFDALYSGHRFTEFELRPLRGT